MVKLLSLYTANFKKPLMTEPLKLPEGVTLICGPNESGKSTLLDAVLYTLYARVIRPSVRPSNEDLISYGKRRAVVRLDFSIGDRVFRAERRIHLNRSNQAYLWEVLPGDHLKPMATGQRQVTTEIENLLAGITFHELISSNVVAQKDLEHLIEQGREDRKKVINAFLNLESFNTVLHDLNEDRKALEGTQARPGKLTVEQQKLDTLQDKLEEYTNRKGELEETEKQISKLEKKIDQLKDDYAGISELHETLETYDKAREQKQHLTSEINGKKQLQKQLHERLEQLEEIRTKAKETEKTLEKYSNLEEAKEALEPAEELVKKAGELRIQLREKETRREEVEKDLSALNEQLGGVDVEKAAKLERRGVMMWPLVGAAVACFVIAFLLLALRMEALFTGILVAVGILFFVLVARQASMESRLRGALTDVKRLEDLNADISNLDGQIQGINHEIRDNESGILKICKGISRYSTIFKKQSSEGTEAVYHAMITAADNDKSEKGKLEERMENLTKQLEEKPSVEKKQQTTSGELENLGKDLDAVEFPTLPKDVQFSQEVLNETRDRKEKIGKELTGNETQLDTSKKSLAKLTTFLDENKGLPEEVEKQDALVQSLKHDQEVTRLAVQGVDKTAGALRSRVKPGVEQYMGVTLPIITNGRYKAVQLDEDYSLKVWDPNAGEFKAKEVFSGGTEDQILLSMRLAFALALLPEVKGMHPEFLFLDEPLASSDEERRQGILQLLHTELAGRFKQIFLISHVAGLETEVENVIRLEDGRIMSSLHA